MTNDFIYMSPADLNGLVYVGPVRGTTFVLKEGPSFARAFDLSGAGAVSSPAVANGIVYIGSHSGKVDAFYSVSGASLWSVSLPNNPGDIVESSPAVANGVVYIGAANGGVYALSAASGAVLWSAITGDAVRSSPTVVNGTVYVGSNDGSIYAYDLPGPPQTVARPDPRTLKPNLTLRLHRSSQGNGLPEPEARSS